MAHMAQKFTILSGTQHKKGMAQSNDFINIRPITLNPSHVPEDQDMSILAVQFPLQAFSENKNGHKKPSGWYFRI